MTPSRALAIAVPEWTVLGRRVATYRFAAHTGLLLAALITVPLAHHRGLSPALMIAILAGGYPSIVALALLRKILTGRERLAFLHHAVFYLLVVSLVLIVVGQPVLAYVDLAAVGVVVFLAVGRMGCFATGCCYGRPHRAGIAYGDAHVRAGLPHSLRGVRLIPIQLWEAGLAITAAAAGVAAVLLNAPIGSALVTCTVLYALGRFFLELFRGEPHRLHWGGLSEAQILSATLCLGMAVAVSFNRPTALGWLLVAASLVLAGAFMLILRRSSRPALLDARELAEVVELLEPWRSIDQGLAPDASAVITTRGGLMVSTSVVDADLGVGLVSFSRSSLPLRAREAKRFGALTRELTGVARTRAFTSPAGVIHVLAEGMARPTGRTNAV